MDFQKLKILMALDEERSISKACLKLYLSQPTLSQMLQRIEQQLGYELFERGRTGLTPTFAGERYIEMCRRILDYKRQVDDEVADYYNRKARKFTLCLSVTWSRLLLPALLPDFHRLYPDVEVNIKLSTSEYVPDIIAKGEADIGLVVPSLDGSTHPEMEYTPLFCDDVLVAVHKDNPLAQKGVEKPGLNYPYLEPELLANEKYILSPPEGRLRQSADYFFEAYDIIPNVVMVDIAVETTAVLASLGVGTTFLSRHFVDEFSKHPNTISDNLRFFHTSKALLPWTIALIHKKSSRNRICNEFINLAKQKLHS